MKGGSPALAASLPDGILLLGVGGGQSKVFELFDRLALAGLGHPADIEKIRQAAIDAAHLEAFTRAPEDVSLRRLVSFGLKSAAQDENFEQIFHRAVPRRSCPPPNSAPRRKKICCYAGLHFDGAFQFQTGGVQIAASVPEREIAAQAWLKKAFASNPSRSDAADLMLQTWWLLTENKPFDNTIPAGGRAPGRLARRHAKPRRGNRLAGSPQRTRGTLRTPHSRPGRLMNRVVGLETEYGCLTSTPAGSFIAVERVRDWIFGREEYGLIDVHHRDWDEPPGNGGFSSTASRVIY